MIEAEESNVAGRIEELASLGSLHLGKRGECGLGLSCSSMTDVTKV